MFTKNLAKWTMAIAALVFIITWGAGGLMIYEGNYESNAWVYVGLVSVLIFFCGLLCLKISRCPHCGKINPCFGKYCPHCGKEIQ